MHFLNKQCIFTTLGLSLVSIGVILAIFWMDIYRYLIANELALAPNTKSFKFWKNPPILLNFDIYLYNWTNPRNLTTEDYEKPILQEIGPYRFREKPAKTKVKWHSNSTISYRRRSTYYFDAEASVGQLDDKITTLNAVAISAANTARDWNFVLQKQVSMGLNLYDQKIYITKDARELLFDGYQDDLIDMAREIAKFDSMNLQIPYDRFGWFYGRNGSDDISGHFNINTGQKDISQLGTTKMWNYKPKTNLYPSDCNTVRGSGGEFYPPGQTKDRPITIFNGEICRSLDLYFTEEINVDGLILNKYSATKRSVDNGTKYSEYECFSYGESVPSGVMNVSACRYGAPVFVSFPHYYAADPYYLDFVDGVHPSRDKHEFYIALEPQTGIPVEVAARLQVNILIRPSPNIALFQEVPYTFFPIIWFEQKFRIPQDMIDDIKIAAALPTIGYICTGVIIAIGLFLLAWVSIQQIKQQKIANKTCKELSNKNSIEIDKFCGKIPEKSPLMKQKKILSDFTIIENQEQPMAPLAAAENDVEYSERETIMMPQ